MKKLISLLLIILITSTMPAMAFVSYDNDDEPNIYIYAKEIDLKSQLRKHFSAYEVTIENKSGRVLRLVDGSFEGGKNGGDAYFEIRKNADAQLKKRVHAWEDWGLWTLGGAWALAVVISPFEWYYNVFTNRRVKEESLQYSQENFFQSDFYPGEKFEKLVLFPIDKNFYLRLSFQDKRSGEVYTIIKDKADIVY